MEHDAGFSRYYLLPGVEDPKINLQSILTRHFLIQSVIGNRFAGCMEQEGRFSAALNWILKHARSSANPDELKIINYALKQGSDNADAIELTRFLLQTYASLPVSDDDITVPNYLDAILAGASLVDGKSCFASAATDTFLGIWRVLLRFIDRRDKPLVSVIEPACGSANDYRFIHAIGLGDFIDYHGFDLCQKNVENARALFPDTQFSVANAFEISAPDKSIDLCYFHDLCEHLSPEGIEAAIGELCRVTRWGICAGFFNMNEIPETVIQPIDEYYWNTLSLDRLRVAFSRHGFNARVLHIGSVLSQKFGCPYTHNPNAYTLVLRPN